MWLRIISSLLIGASREDPHLSQQGRVFSATLFAGPEDGSQEKRNYV